MDGYQYYDSDQDFCDGDYTEDKYDHYEDQDWTPRVNKQDFYQDYHEDDDDVNDDYQSYQRHNGESDWPDVDLKDNRELSNYEDYETYEDHYEDDNSDDSDDDDNDHDDDEESTRYQSSSKVWGEFQCPKCHKKWLGGNHWVKTEKERRNRAKTVFPYIHRPFKVNIGLHRSTIQPEILCDNCQLLGHRC